MSFLYVSATGKACETVSKNRHTESSLDGESETLRSPTLSAVLWPSPRAVLRCVRFHRSHKKRERANVSKDPERDLYVYITCSRTPYGDVMHTSSYRHNRVCDNSRDKRVLSRYERRFAFSRLLPASYTICVAVKRPTWLHSCASSQPLLQQQNRLCRYLPSLISHATIDNKTIL